MVNSKFQPQGYSPIFERNKPQMVDDEEAEIVRDEARRRDADPDTDAVRTDEDDALTGQLDDADEDDHAGDESLQGKTAAERAKARIEATPTPKRNMRKISLNVPPEAYDALFERARKNRTTLQFEIFKALRGNGIPIRKADMIEDGRRHNAKRRK